MEKQRGEFGPGPSSIFPVSSERKRKKGEEGRGILEGVVPYVLCQEILCLNCLYSRKEERGHKYQ